VASKNASIVEKAKRLVDTCRERSLKHDDDAPLVLTQLRIGCGLKDDYPFNRKPRILKPYHDILGFLYSNKVQFEREELCKSIQHCLAGYSMLVDESDDLYPSTNGWDRGLRILADFYPCNRMVYWFDFKGYVECRDGDFDEFVEAWSNHDDDDDIPDINYHYRDVDIDVYNQWKISIQNRFVMHWSNIFDAIQTATQAIIDIQSVDSVETIMRTGKWFNVASNEELNSDKLRKAMLSGNLKECVQPDGRGTEWLYSVDEVKRRYPISKSALNNALSFE
jgi:hypothetical protein